MKKILLIFTLSSFIMVGCKVRPTEKNTNNQTPAHSSRNSVDWNGTYYGMLPCDGCEGIQTELILNNDLTYRLSGHYLGRKDSTITHTGSFHWNESGSNISLGGDGVDAKSNTYKVGENKLYKLDGSGNRITGELSLINTLTKKGFDNGITNKYWKLIELKGETIVPENNSKTEIHFILKPENNKIYGFAGCNKFNGTYEIKEGNRIVFSKMAATLMACMDDNYENEFLKVFDTADNFSMLNDTLSLNKARMAPLAKFEAVYFK